MPTQAAGPYVDFVDGAVGHRLRQGGGKHQDLPRAVGLTKGPITHVADATAGLGRDGFLLASLGVMVTLIERSPQMHAALQDGMDRARVAGPPWDRIMDRMILIHGDAKDVLPGLSVDVVVVDPMHPPRHNSALVKKEMRDLRQIVGADPDALDLMRVALQVARKRVVLKWPLKALPLAGLVAPSHQILGKTTRYDVFMIHASS